MLQKKPKTIKLSQPRDRKASGDFKWDQMGRLRQDACAIRTDEKESMQPGDYQLAGYDPSKQTPVEYANLMRDPMHSQKMYRNELSYVNDESKLIQSELSNMRTKTQLWTRPYAGFYCGPGMRSLGLKDVESALQQGLTTNPREGPCQVYRGQPTQRFDCLPEFGNPQRTEHIIPPPVHDGGWVRGGDNTRDYVRRVDYQRRCGNKINNTVIPKGQGHYGSPAVPVIDESGKQVGGAELRTGRRASMGVIRAPLLAEGTN
jgi:hypothetical protein